jgi:hypothetical protein
MAGAAQCDNICALINVKSIMKSKAAKWRQKKRNSISVAAGDSVAQRRNDGEENNGEMKKLSWQQAAA